MSTIHHNFTAQRDLKTIAQNTDVQCSYQVVEGDIFLVRNFLYYAGYNAWYRMEHIVDSAGKPLVVDPDDVLVQVWATSEAVFRLGISSTF